jgi:hypothetical protein
LTLTPGAPADLGRSRVLALPAGLWQLEQEVR